MLALSLTVSEIKPVFH